MVFIKLTERRFRRGHVTINIKNIVAIEDQRFSTEGKDFAWTNLWMTNGIKLEVLETEQEILDLIYNGLNIKEEHEL